jgi:hypothetical protein
MSEGQPGIDSITVLRSREDWLRKKFKDGGHWTVACEYIIAWGGGGGGEG